MAWLFRRHQRQRQPSAEAHPLGKLREGWFEALLTKSGFLRRYPQYAGIVARMNPLLTTAVPYMAVGLRRWDDPAGRVQLLVNRTLLVDEPQFIAGVLLHEVHHVVLGHLSDSKFHAVANPAAMEVAMELSANENIRESLPRQGLDLEMFREHGVVPGQSTMERYAHLAEAVRNGRLRLPDLGRAIWDSHRPRQAGGCAIGPGDLLDARSDGALASSWSRRPRPGPQWSASELERMQRCIDQHLGGERSGGDDVLDGTQRRVAKELPRHVLGRGRHTRLDWPRILRAVFPRQQRVHPDYKRPNRRFPERVGELPGRTRRPPRPHLLAALDTSGSMDSATLERVVSEVQQLRRHARLTILLCDAAVHRVATNGALDVLTGGGDTDFGPVFDELPMIRDCDGVVYFTDGRGDMPASPPTTTTLWVLTHERQFAPGFGTIVRMPESNE